MHVHCQFYRDWQESARELIGLSCLPGGWVAVSFGVWVLASALALLAFAKDSHCCIKGEGNIMPALKNPVKT